MVSCGSLRFTPLADITLELHLCFIIEQDKMQSAAANCLVKHQHKSTSGPGSDYNMTENTIHRTRQAAGRVMDSTGFQHGGSLSGTNFLTSCSYFFTTSFAQHIYLMRTLLFPPVLHLL